MSTEYSVRADLASALGSDYEIVRELGRGGASVVYLGRDRVLGRAVAIKVIRDPQAADAEAVARFEREARTLAALQHPNIVMLYGAKPLPGGSLALVMQHGEWSTLKALIREQGPLPIEAVQQILRDVALALVYLHRHLVVHRDIKPENIFIEADSGRALLSDFGIAKSRDGRASVTLTGVVIGTPAYMSPEQIDGGELTGRSDLYSLGMVGYEMLTGARPWDGESLFSVIYKQKTEKLPGLELRRPDTPQHLQTLIERATEKAPEERWSTAEEFLAALEGSTAVAPVRSWAKGIAAVETNRPPVEYATLELGQELVEHAFSAASDGQLPARRRRFMAAAVIVLLFSGGAGALAFSGRQPAQGGDRADVGAAGNRVAMREEAGDPSTGLDVEVLLAGESPLVGPTVDSGPPSAAAAGRTQGTSDSPARAGEESTRRAVAVAQAPAATVPDETSASLPDLLPEPSIARRVEPRRLEATAPISRMPVDTDTGAPPQLQNRERISQLLADRYPVDLRSRGIGGTTVLTVLVGADGSVLRSSIMTSSGSARLDEAARVVADRMVFEHPGGAARQAMWVAVPLTFEPQ